MKRAQIKKFALGSVLFLGLLAINIYGISCMPSLVSPDEEIPLPELPVATGEYGLFMVYRVGDGAIKSLNDSMVVPYRVTDVSYLPSSTIDKDEDRLMDYNIQHCGDGYDPGVAAGATIDEDISIFYYPPGLPHHCNNRAGRYASDHPEALIDNGNFYLYYTNYPSLDLEASYNCGLPQQLPNTKPTAASLNSLSCAGLIVGDSVGWVNIPLATITNNLGLDPAISRIPLRIRILLEQEYDTIAFPRTVDLELYEGSTVVASSRYGFDYAFSLDPVIGYLCDRTRNDYYLKVTISTPATPLAPLLPPNQRHQYKIYFEATPLIPVGAIPDSDGDGLPEAVDELSRIYRAGLVSARSGNLVKDWYFYPDNPQTEIKDNYPDCDGIPDSGDEGDWGIYDPTCPFTDDEVGEFEDDLPRGARDGNMQYWEVDNKENIDDGYRLKGVQTNLWSMGYEAPSVVKVGNEYWMFLTTGPGIYLITSNDGINWDLSNIYNDRPSLLPRKMDPNASGDSKAPVVSSGKFGYCETTAQGDDIQTVKLDVVNGVTVPYGFPDTICVTFGEDGVLDSYPMVDEQNGSTINSGPDGIINTWFFPKKLNHPYPLIYKYYESTVSGAPGNPHLYAQDGVNFTASNANNEIAFLLGDDQWASEEIGLNPAEYWYKQNCNPYLMGEHFLRCALGGKSNVVSARPGADGILNTVTSALSGDDRLCLSESGQVAICPGENGVFDQPQSIDLLAQLEQAIQPPDGLCPITPAVGLEYVRFRYSDTYKLKHKNVDPSTLKVVSLTTNSLLTGDITPNEHYQIISLPDGEVELKLGNNNWLAPNPPESRKYDVLIAYYRYQGSQIGICDDGDGVITVSVMAGQTPISVSIDIDDSTNVPPFFYQWTQTLDRYFLGPPMESPDGSWGGGVGGFLPELGDAYAGDVVWNPTTRAFHCPDSSCAIAPGSDNTLNILWRLADRDPDFPNRRAPAFDNEAYPGFNILGNNNYGAWPKHYDLYGYFDDWYCPARQGGATVRAICPGGNGYFQIYRLWKRQEIARYENMDDLLENYEKPEGECYDLEVREEKEEYYESTETSYVLYRYEGVLRSC